uniref:Uncharacterized protein n=1 Tax=Scleropages formosus TaxID=113540 RepID=A0A8C9TCV7_SCLFO
PTSALLVLNFLDFCQIASAKIIPRFSKMLVLNSFFSPKLKVLKSYGHIPNASVEIILRFCKKLVQKSTNIFQNASSKITCTFPPPKYQC